MPVYLLYFVTMITFNGYLEHPERKGTIAIVWCDRILSIIPRMDI